MLETNDILWGMIAPAIIAAIVVLVSAIPRRQDRATQPWGPALAISGAQAAAYYGIAGGLRFPPAGVEHWVVWLGIPVVAMAVLATALPRRSRLVAVASAALLAVFAWLLMPPSIRTGSGAAAAATVAVVAVGLIVWWLALDALAARAPGPGMPLLLAIFAAGVAAVLINSHTQTLGKVAGGVAVALGVMAVSALWLKRLTLARGGVLALTVSLMGLALCGHFLADMSRLDLLLLWAAPLALWAGELPVARRKTSTCFAARAVAMLIVLLIPLVPAINGLRQTMQDQLDSFSY